MPWPRQEPRFPPPAQILSPSNVLKHWPVGQLPPPAHRLAQVPLGRTVCVSSAGHAQVPLWQVAQPPQSVSAQQLAHCPLLQSLVPVGQEAAQVPSVQTSLQHWLFLVQCFPLRLQPIGSAPASPMPNEASVPPTRAAPINLSALPRVMLPLASPLARSSKEWLEVSWLTCCPLSRRARH